MCFVGSKHWNLLALFIVLRIVKYFGVASENCYQNDGYKGVYRGYRHHRHRADDDALLEEFFCFCLGSEYRNLLAFGIALRMV